MVALGAPSADETLLLVESLANGTTVDVDVGVPSAHAKKKRRRKRKKKSSKKKAAAKKTAKPEEKDDAQELRTTGPARLQLPVSEKEFDNSAKADRKRDESIEEIRTLLPKVKGPAKGELIFRLAELYWQKSKFVYAQEFKEFDADYQRYADEGHQGKEPKLERYTKKSEAYKKQALSNYSVVLAKYPDYPRLDEVLYIMAYNEYQAGRKKPAIKNYSQLIRQYPKSEYVPDSYLALGEHYFGANDLSKATKAFKKAYSTGKKANKPATYRYAQYKLAWCDYNRQEYDKALTKFKDVITDSEKAGDDDGIQLKSEALNDMVLTYSHLGEVEGAYKYFKKKAGNERAFHLTTKLAQVYQKDGKHKLQVQTLRHLINTDPENPSAPDFQSQIVAAYSQLGERNQVRKEVTRMVELYRPGSAWWRKNEGNQMAVERALTLAESRMRELVTDYHRYAQKFKKYDDYELARDIYAQYLAAFPTSQEAYRLNFFYAEILWDLGEWEKAAEQYDAVVKRDPDGEYTRKCAFNSVLAWEKLSKGEKPPKRNRDGVLVESSTKKKKKKGNLRKETLVVEKLNKKVTYEPKKIPRFERKLADACDAYVSVVPEEASRKDKKLEEELIQVKFKAGYIFQKYYHFDEAATRFGELIDRWPTSEFAREGADAILDSYASREKYNELEKWSRTFAKNKPLMKDKKFSKTVYKLMEGASFKSIELVNNEVKSAEKKEGKKTEELNERYAKVADRFEGFVEEFPQSEYAPIALFNAMDIYDGANKIDLALRDAHRLLKEYPKEIATGPLGEAEAETLIRLNLVRYYELIADYEESAKRSEEFVEKYPKHKNASDVLYNAGIFYLGLGDTTNAVKNFAKYIKDFNKKKDVPDVYLKMAKIYEDNKDYKRAIAFYSDFEKKYGKRATDKQVMLTRYKSAELAEKADRVDEMRQRCDGILKGYKKYSSELKKEAITQLAGGYCAFKLLEPQYEAYKAIKIEAPKGMRGAKVMKAIRGQLDLKLKKRDELAKAYVDVLNYGNGEWGVAGLYRAADALLEYVDALRTAPDPPPLRNNFDALDIFRAELDNIAFPVEDEAINALEKALQKAFELQIYSEYTLAIQEKLRLYRPAKFGEVHELPFFASSGERSSQTAQK